MQQENKYLNGSVKTLLAFAGALVIVVGFQNCGGGFQLTSNSIIGTVTESSEGPVSESNDLGYPYSEKPEYMAELDVGTVKQVDTNTLELSVDGVIVDLDSPETGVDYEIRWENASGQAICPPRVGKTEATARAFEYKCVATNVTAKVTAKIYAQSADQNKQILVREIDYNGLL